MQHLKTVLLISAGLSLAACENEQSDGFTLPKGDVDAGQVVFQARQCTSCHTVKGVTFELGGMEPEMALQLGGKMRQVYTYGQLVTSIINPSHRLSNRFPGEELDDFGISKMRNYNRVLTVKELTDLVAFLEAHYELEPYKPTQYSHMPG